MLSYLFERKVRTFFSSIWISIVHLEVLKSTTNVFGSISIVHLEVLQIILMHEGECWIAWLKYTFTYKSKFTKLTLWFNKFTLNQLTIWF